MKTIWRWTDHLNIQVSNDDASELSGTPNNHFTFALGSHVASLLVAHRNELLRFKSATRVSKTFPCEPGPSVSYRSPRRTKDRQISRIFGSFVIAIHRIGIAQHDTRQTKVFCPHDGSKVKRYLTSSHRNLFSGRNAFPKLLRVNTFQRFFFVVFRFCPFRMSLMKVNLLCNWSSRR